jgi:kynurenine formamidase
VHVQGGGHISHWSGAPADMEGLWEMPAETFMGPAAVCNLQDLMPEPARERGDYPVGRVREGDPRGQEIKSEHLSNVEVGDVVLLTSPFEDVERPWLSADTCSWLVSDRKIRMLGIGAGILWQYAQKAAAPGNSPVKRVLLGGNVPIVQPLVNIDTLTKDRVFYVSLPLRMTKMEASFTRAIAFEEE